MHKINTIGINNRYKSVTKTAIIWPNPGMHTRTNCCLAWNTVPIKVDTRRLCTVAPPMFDWFSRVYLFVLFILFTTLSSTDHFSSLNFIVAKNTSLYICDWPLISCSVDGKHTCVLVTPLGTASLGQCTTLNKINDK